MAWIFCDDGEPEAEDYITNYRWLPEVRPQTMAVDIRAASRRDVSAKPVVSPWAFIYRRGAVQVRGGVEVVPRASSEDEAARAG